MARPARSAAHYYRSKIHSGPLSDWLSNQTVRRVLNLNKHLCNLWGTIACAHCNMVIPEGCKGNCNCCHLPCPCNGRLRAKMPDAVRHAATPERKPTRKEEPCP